jgi:hypothetical protein
MDHRAEFDLTQEHADRINALLPTCQYVVGIRENATGEVRFHAEELPWDDSTLFWWSDGNNGCDCNRASFFHDSDIDCPCGFSQYTVVGIWIQGGDDIRDLDELNSWRPR